MSKEEEKGIKDLLIEVKREIVESREVATQHRNATTSDILKQVLPMNEAIKVLSDWRDNHEEEDRTRFGNMDNHIVKADKFMLDMQPMIDTFKNNEIVEMGIDKKTNKLILRVKHLTTISIFIGIVLAFFKFIFVYFTTK